MKNKVHVEEWISTEDKLPPENVAVKAIPSDGNVRILFRQGNLWFVEDGSMYVYFTPEKWSYL